MSILQYGPTILYIGSGSSRGLLEEGVQDLADHVPVALLELPRNRLNLEVGSDRLLLASGFCLGSKKGSHM